MMDSQIVIVGGSTGDAVEPQIRLVCDRVGCGWTYRFDGPTPLEVVNTVAADHWSSHVVEIGSLVLGILRDTVDDLRLRLVETLAGAQNVPSIPQAPVSEPAETVGDDRATRLAERLHEAHGAVWHCPDCGGLEVTIVDGLRICDSCNWHAPVELGGEAPPESDDLDLTNDDGVWPPPIFVPPETFETD